MTHSRKLVAALLMLSAIAVARGDEPRTNKWQMQVGWVHQWGRGMTVSGPAPAITVSDLSALPLGGLIMLPAGGANSTDPTLMRIFDNGGYVGPDLWTGDASLNGTDRAGMTWNWGANASQYNSVTHELTYQVAGRDAVMGATTMSGGTSDKDNLPTDGVEIKFSRRLFAWTNCNLTADGPCLVWTNGNASLDLVMGMALFPRVSQHIARQASLDVSSIAETYTYSDYYGTSAGGGLPPLDMPYYGTFGNAGPLIPELPEFYNYTTLNQLGTARDRVAIDSKILRVRGEIGLTLTKEITQRLSVYVSPQFALELLDMDAYRSETLTYTDAGIGGTSTIASRTDHKHEVTLIPAFLLTGGADYLLSENWYVGASLGWEWLARNPSIRVGANRVRFNLDGGEFSLYLGRHF